MLNPTFPRAPREVSFVKPEVLRLALDPPLDAAFADAEPSPSVSPADTQLKFVQIGLWEARRRWLAGQTDDFDTILARLDEDVELLRRAIEDDEPVPARGPGRTRPCEPAALV